MRTVEPFEIIARHYEIGSVAHRILVIHSVLVARKAIELAGAYRERHPDRMIDLALLEEICLLHDIGIVKTAAPDIGCHGDAPYIRHGVIGRELLDSQGLEVHALACERHTGSGIPENEVIAQRLPIPHRDYLPVTLEEKILCVADKYYGKNPETLWREKSDAKIRRSIGRYGEAALERWERLRAEICG